MIYVDHNKGSIELLPLILRQGVKAERTSLPSSDFCFEGNGPRGPINIGIERKTLHDILDCVESGRYNRQRIDMAQMFDISVLMVEGHWKPHDPDGTMMEGFDNGLSWGYCRPGGQRIPYSKLYRYLIGVASTGVIITYPRSMWQCAFDICEWFHYWNRPYDSHKSMREIQKVAVPTLNFRATLTRKWADSLNGIDVTLGERAERHFRKPITLAEADESEWLKLPGIGVKTAKAIVKEIRGW